MSAVTMHHFSGLAAPFVRSKGTVSGGVFRAHTSGPSVYGKIRKCSYATENRRINQNGCKENQVANPVRTDIELSDKVKEINKQLEKTPDDAELWIKRGLALVEQNLMREAA